MDKSEYTIQSYNAPAVIGQSSADYEFVILAKTKVDATDVVSQIILDRQNGTAPANLEVLNTNPDYRVYKEEKGLVSVRLLKLHS